MARDLDWGDPAVRAERRLSRGRGRDTRLRVVASVALAATGVIAPFVAEPITGGAGSRVGAFLAGLLLVGLAVVVWPRQWSGAEQEHHRLQAIWREARPGAGSRVPWTQYSAWAEAGPKTVSLQLLSRMPNGASGRPSPYSVTTVEHVDPADVEAAAEAYEAVRERAHEQELGARESHEQERRALEQKREDAERRRHEERLAAIEHASDAEAKAREEQSRKEIADAKASEDAAQAAAVARALRR